MNLNSIFLEAIEDIIYNIQLAQEIILNIKHQYVKHDEESIMVWKAFSIQEIEYIINDIMNKKILKTHMLPYDFLKKKQFQQHNDPKDILKILKKKKL